MSLPNPPARFASRDPRGAGSIRGALLAGFAVVFALWLLWGYQLVRSLEQIEQNVAVVHDAYVRGEQTLSKIRTNVLLGSIYLRDALIDGGTARRDTYRGELIRLRTEAEQLLGAYLQDVSSEDERGHWARLQGELADYWTSRDVALGDRAKTPDEAAALLRSRVVPKREAVLQILDQLGALQAAANQRHQTEIDVLYRQVRMRLLSMGAATLIVALLVAVMASRHVNRLQSEIERQRRNEQHNREGSRAACPHGSWMCRSRSVARLARELHDEVGPGPHRGEDGHRHRLFAATSTGARAMRWKKPATSAKPSCAASATCRSCCTRLPSTISACPRR
jgi:hypothetical protein